MSLLSVRDVSVTFGGVAALKNVSLTVAPGEVVAVIGPNGAGKSTLFNALTGMAPLAGGTITLRGKPLRRALRPRHVILGAAFAAVMALGAVLLHVGPEAAFEDILVRPYEVAYVAEQRGGTDSRALAQEPGAQQRLLDVMAGAPSVGASWQGFGVWLPHHVQAGPLFASLGAARAHAQLLAHEPGQRARTVARWRRHRMAALVGLVLGAAAYAQVFARSRRSPDHIARMGIARTFQNIRLFGALSVLDNVRVAQRQGGNDATQRAMALLERVGLGAHAHRPAQALAYGDMRRLEIARALATVPQVLLLDEPAAGMNATETAGLQTLIGSIRAQGIAILLIEHDMPLVMDLADRVVVLEYGLKIADGPPHEVQSDPRVIGAYLGQAPAEDATPVIAEVGDAQA